MIKQLVFLSISVFNLLLSSCNAQDTLVYEIPFSLEKKLLVFKGKLNGVETDFAFDTGAAEGIATTKDEKRNAVSRTNSTQQIIDGNGKIIQLPSGFSKELSIGGFTFLNVRASINDMQYLYCMDLYLLGADIIRKLNWEIDFTKKILKVSKKRFETIESMTIIPVKYEYNIPRTKLSINNTNFNNVMIDIGYSGSMTIPSNNQNILALLEKKRQQHLLTSTITSSFAQGGMSKPALTETILIDSLKIDESHYYNITADFKEKTDFKIGLNFFNSICEKLIINNSEKKYYLLLKANRDLKKSFPVSVLLKDKKLKIISITLNETFQNNDFSIDEEVNSVNGKTASDFKDDCDFMTWYYLTISKLDELVIEKLNLKKIELKKSLNR